MIQETFQSNTMCGSCLEPIWTRQLQKDSFETSERNLKMNLVFYIKEVLILLYEIIVLRFFKKSPSVLVIHTEVYIVKLMWGYALKIFKTMGYVKQDWQNFEYCWIWVMATWGYYTILPTTVHIFVFPY